MFLGEIISLVVAVAWTATALFAEVAIRRAGQIAVNVMRMALSIVFLSLTLWFFTGHPLPLHTDGETWLWLSLSGFVGYAFGDYCLFNAYLTIGSRYGQLFMTLASPFAALGAWMFLGEKLSWLSLLGMTICMSGISISVLSQETKQEESKQSHIKRRTPHVNIRFPLRGMLFAIGAAAGQGFGLVLSKMGMMHYETIIPVNDIAATNMIPFASTMIRAVTGLVCFSLIMAFSHKFYTLPRIIRDRKAMWTALCAIILGPFVGVSLSLMAVQMAPAGIAQTLMSLTPILILLPSRILFHTPITWKDTLGAIIAVIGVCLFFI